MCVINTLIIAGLLVMGTSGLSDPGSIEPPPQVDEMVGE